MDLRTKYLLKASREGDIEHVRLCVSSNGDEIINCEENGKPGRTPLYMAARNGFIQVVQFCVEHGAIVDLSTLDGWTPLLRAARKGYLDVLQFLADSGANINTFNLNGNTALHLSSGEGHLHVVKYLLEGQSTETEIDKGDNNGWTALHWASCYGHETIVEYLLSHGADGNKLDHSGCSPLHCAAEEGHLPSVLMLLQTGNVDIDIRNDNGQLPSEVASCEEIKMTICHEQIERQNNAKVTMSASSSSSTSLHPLSSLSLPLPLPYSSSLSSSLPPLLPRRPSSPSLVPIPPLPAPDTLQGHEQSHEQGQHEIQDNPIQGLDNQGLGLQLEGCDEIQKSTSSSINYITCRTNGTDSQKCIIITDMSSTNTHIHIETNGSIENSNGSLRSQKHGYDEISSTVRLTDGDMSVGTDNNLPQQSRLKPEGQQELQQELKQEVECASSCSASQKDKKRRVMDDDER